MGPAPPRRCSGPTPSDGFSRGEPGLLCAQAALGLALLKPLTLQEAADVCCSSYSNLPEARTKPPKDEGNRSNHFPFASANILFFALISSTLSFVFRKR